MSRSEPLVSVVIPTHNRRDLVAKAIASVVRQTHKQTEIIVVDDASTDGTADWIEARLGGVVRLIRSRENIERAAARNLGADAANGEYLAFLDSDDEWLPHKLAMQLRFAAPKTVVLAGLQVVDESGRDRRRIYIPRPNAWRQLGRENPYLAAPSTILLSKTLFTETRGFPEDRDVQGSEDWLLLATLAAQGSKFAVIPEPLVAYRVHSSNSTAEAASIARSMWAAADWLDERNLITARDIRDRRARIASLVARKYAAEREVRDAAWWTRRAFLFGGIRTGLPGALWATVSTVAGKPIAWPPAAPHWWPFSASWRRSYDSIANGPLD